MAAVVLLLQLTSHRVGLQGSLGRLAHAQRQLLSKLVEAPAGTKQGQQNSGCMALYSIADLSKFEQAVPATVVRDKPEIWLLTCGGRQASHCLDVAVTSTTLTFAILQLQPTTHLQLRQSALALELHSQDICHRGSPAKWWAASVMSRTTARYSLLLQQQDVVGRGCTAA